MNSAMAYSAGNTNQQIAIIIELRNLIINWSPEGKKK